MHEIGRRGIGPNYSVEDAWHDMKMGTVRSQMMLERFANFAELSGIKEPIYVKRK